MENLTLMSMKEQIEKIIEKYGNAEVESIGWTMHSYIVVIKTENGRETIEIKEE